MLLFHHLEKNDRLIFILLSLWLLVDSFNGAFLRLGVNIPISQIYKFSVFLIIVSASIKSSFFRDRVIILLFYLGIYAFNLLLQDTELTEQLIIVFKLLSSFAIYYYFGHLFIDRNKTYSNNQLCNNILQIVQINGIVFIFNILLGILGIGFHSYTEGDGVGYCGFFYAINELSGVSAVLIPISLAYFKLKHSGKSYYALCCLFLIVSAILSTKSTALVTLISIFGISYLYGSNREKKIMIISIILFFILIITYLTTILSAEFGAIVRFSYFMENRGIVGALTSGRLDFWENMKHEFYDAESFFKLFGIVKFRTVEIDPYDVLMNCGYFGLTILMMIYLKLIISPLRYTKNIYSKAIFLSNLLLVFISIISGHIVFSSMAGLFIACSNSILNYHNKMSITNGKLTFIILQKYLRDIRKIENSTEGKIK